MLIVLHGAGGQGPGMAALTGLDRRGPAAGFVTVFPDGVNRVWNDTRDAPALRQRESVDDVRFLQSLVQTLGSQGRGRAQGVYLVGISNGALMSEHLARSGSAPGRRDRARRRSGHGDGARGDAAAGAARRRSWCSRALPIRWFRTGAVRSGSAGSCRVRGRHGRAWDRGPGRGDGHGVGAGERHRQAPLVGHSTPPRDLPVTLMSWRAQDAPPVFLYRIEGGGHTWPGGGQYLPARIIGRTARTARRHRRVAGPVPPERGTGRVACAGARHDTATAEANIVAALKALTAE